MVIITSIAAAAVILAFGLLFYLANGARVPNGRLGLPKVKSSTKEQKHRAAGIN
jgi:hypothetical protein